ncbi:MAG: hypothetical protein H6658_18545 [Ardenticatenaceae bacterium]|nr:hypothetical protein [Ardenticatenaceae bacterium]
MTPGWQVEALIELVRLRYEAWTDFDHPPFVADEIEYKQKAVTQAAEWLHQVELDRLIAHEEFDAFLERLDKLAQATNLLFLRVPSQGDTAVLHTPHLDKATFCTHFRNLLHADRATPDRLQTFSDYLTAHDLPNKWTFPTYFLFLCHPDSEMFVKPQTAEWFLKFMGQPLSVSGAPEAATYAAIRSHVHTIYNDLRPYGVHDMVDVQSMIWVGYREAKARIGRLDPKGQIELGVPEFVPEPVLTYEIGERTAVLRETNEEMSTLVTKKSTVPRNDYFTVETFDLLAAIHDNPTKEFYDSAKMNSQYVEEPFQELMREVALELPPDILAAMETESDCFRVFVRMIMDKVARGLFIGGHFTLKVASERPMPNCQCGSTLNSWNSVFISASTGQNSKIDSVKTARCIMTLC